jgi:hypothetical protein
MTHQKCELKERLEIHARKANRLIERARTYTPEPDARKGALGDVELAGLNLERSRRKFAKYAVKNHSGRIRPRRAARSM